MRGEGQRDGKGEGEGEGVGVGVGDRRGTERWKGKEKNGDYDIKKGEENKKNKGKCYEKQNRVVESVRK